VAACATPENYNGFDRLVIFYPSRNSVINGGLGRSGLEQGGYQIAALVMTLGMAIVGGIVTGLILKTPFFEQIDNTADLFDDEKDWILPNDELFAKKKHIETTQI